MASPSQNKKRSRGSSSTSTLGCLETWFVGDEEAMRTFLHEMSRTQINVPKVLQCVKKDGFKLEGGGVNCLKRVFANFSKL